MSGDPKHTVLRSATREVVIGGDQPFCLIGERLNPTGRKIFAEQLRRGDLSRIAVDVEQQVAGGATMLDINMGVPLADEAELLAKAVTMVQELTDLPLCIDSSVDRGARGRARGVPGQGAGQLDHRRAGADGRRSSRSSSGTGRR